MFCVIPLDELEKPKFDAYIEGILFDADAEIAVNLFIVGLSVKERASNLYKVKTDLNNSEIGKIRDRLVTKVHNTPILVVSEKFKNLLQKSCKEHAEFYPVEFDVVNKKPLHGYYICNLIKKYDCTDYGNSELFFEHYDDEEGYSGINTINSLTIDESKIPKGTHIFLLGNISKPVVIISNELKQEIENQKITGFKFVLPEDFVS